MANLRIIGGTWGGRRIEGPASDETRPFLDRMREALFSILGHPVDGDVLDLYAGTGSLGLEALSRGGRHCTFVERSPRARAVLKANIETLACGDRSSVVARPVERFVRTLETCFALIFFDPPYAHLHGPERRAVIDAASVLNRQRLVSGGRFVFHYPRDLLDPNELDLIGACRARNYGTSTLAIFEHSSARMGPERSGPER